MAVITAVIASCSGGSALAQVANMTSGGQSLSSLVPNRATGLYDAHEKEYCGQYPTMQTYHDADQKQTIPQRSENYNIGGNSNPGAIGGTAPQLSMPNEPVQEQMAAPAPKVAKNQPNLQSHWFYNYSAGVPDAPFPIGPNIEQQPCTSNCGQQLGSPAKANSAFVDAMPVLDKPYLQTQVTNPGATAIILAAFAKQAAEDNAPSRKIPGMLARQEGQVRGASEAAADGAEATEAAAMTEALLGLINVANENAAVPGLAQQPTKILPQAIWMVQQMFHKVYIPMAILLLLPGALMTQMKAVVSYGFLSGVPEDEEMRGPSPFVGIFRSIIAIFLIPATQLVISWMIDIGNSMTFEVEKYLVPAEVFDWMKDQTFNPPTENDENNLTEKASNDRPQNPSSNDTEAPQGNPKVLPEHAGKAQSATERFSSVRDQQAMTQAMQAGFNIAALTIAGAFAVLLAFQTVMMCYLLLLGPIAAAFYAWPSGIGSLFKKVFINWVDAVINLALWRFWWVVVVLIMYVRIQYLKALGMYQPNSQWELAMYTAFMVIICYVPFMPFEFKPGEMVAKVLEKAEQAGKGGGGGGGGGDGGGGDDTSSSQGSPSAVPNGQSQSTPQQSPHSRPGGQTPPAQHPPPPGANSHFRLVQEGSGGHGHETDQTDQPITAPPPVATV